MAKPDPKAGAESRLCRIIERTTQRYALKLARGDASVRADHDLTAQVRAYQMAMQEQEKRMAEARKVLGRAGVPLNEFLLYRNFVRHIDRLCRTRTGRTLDLLIQTAILRWQAYGLDRKILLTLCQEVFGMEFEK